MKESRYLYCIELEVLAMALLQKKLLDAINMAKNILLLAVALFSIILEITLYFFRGIESLSIYLILVRFFIIYLSVVYFPFFIISLGFIPSIMTNDIIKSRSEIFEPYFTIYYQFRDKKMGLDAAHNSFFKLLCKQFNIFR